MDVTEGRFSAGKYSKNAECLEAATNRLGPNLSAMNVHRPWSRSIIKGHEVAFRSLQRHERCLPSLQLTSGFSSVSGWKTNRRRRQLDNEVQMLDLVISRW